MSSGDMTNTQFVPAICQFVVFLGNVTKFFAECDEDPFFFQGWTIFVQLVVFGDDITCDGVYNRGANMFNFNVNGVHTFPNVVPLCLPRGSGNGEEGPDSKVVFIARVGGDEIERRLCDEAGARSARAVRAT